MTTGRTPPTKLLSDRVHPPALFADVVASSTAWAIAAVLSANTTTRARSVGQYAVLGLFVVAGTVVALVRQGVYRRRTAPHRTEETAAITLGCISGMAAVLAGAVITDLPLVAGELVWVPLAFSFLVACHGYRRTLAELRAPAGTARERVVVIGAGYEAAELIELVEHHPETGFEIVGVVGAEQVVARHGLAHWWLGPVDRVVDILAAVRADSVIVTSTGFRGDQFRTITTAVLDHGYLTRISTGVSRWNSARLQVDSMVHEPLLAVHAHRRSSLQLRMKRIADVVGASVLLTCTAPLMAAAALAIKLEDGGPVLFRQRRIGYGGAEFNMTKFRSMGTDAESRLEELDVHNERSGPLFKVQLDPRVTRVGSILRETSIDELPQLFDVLRGDMSLVGPRPPLPAERTAFDVELERRFSVRPGITGLWQVEARDNANFEAYRRLDLHYVENWSPWLDVCIVLATYDQLLTRTVTMPLRRRHQRRLAANVPVRPDTSPVAVSPADPVDADGCGLARHAS